MKEISISVRNISKIYPLYNKPIDRLKEALHPFRKNYHHDFYALNNVTFDVPKGETVGILGQNGSGKSTLLKIITGVITPNSGSVSVSGKISSLLELGTGFSPELTGRENIYFYGTINGLTENHMNERLDDILSFADIGEFIEQPVKTYSSGMFVRLAFACAIQIDPDILIVDEALAVGDMRFVQKCLRKIDQFKKDNKTILLVSHDVSYIQSSASKALWLEKGILRDSGNPKEIVKHYQFFMSYGLNSSVHLKSELKKDIEKFEENEEINIESLTPESWIPIVGLESFGVGGAKITNVALVNSKSEKVTSTSGEEVLSLFFIVESEIEVNDPILGFLIRNKKGDNVIGINSDICNFEVPSLHSGKKHVFKFSFELPRLLIGEYSISLSIAKGTQISNSQLHWVYDAVIFTVDSLDIIQKLGSIIVPRSIAFEASANLKWNMRLNQ